MIVCVISTLGWLFDDPDGHQNQPPVEGKALVFRPSCCGGRATEPRASGCAGAELPAEGALGPPTASFDTRAIVILRDANAMQALFIMDIRQFADYRAVS